MNPATMIAAAAGKAASALARALRLGGGTNFPGAVARQLAPRVLRDLAAALPQGVVLVSGTNGKTTTTRMIAEMLRGAGLRPLHNRSGANLVTGLTATAIMATDWRGRPRADLGLFETDEAALPQAIAETGPRLVLIHNLFRDQLDRYGEVDTVAAAWRAALAGLPAGATLVLNADDPAVAALGEGLIPATGAGQGARVCYYGLDDPAHATGAAGHIADSQFCRRCGARYDYSLAFYAHIGHYACPRCGHRRPAPQVRLARLDLCGTEGARLYLSYPGGAMELALPLPGLYNALNALAAAAAGLALGIEPATVRAALEGFSAAFGRIERVLAPGGPPMLIALIKNPVGASETVRMLVERSRLQVAGSPQHVADYDAEPSSLPPATLPPSSLPPATCHLPPLTLLIAINDNYADGTDVSWLWDADFEALAGRVATATVSGTRAADMAVRLKYAGVEPERIRVEPDLARAVEIALAAVPAGATLYALPTYTAMLALRADLARRGWVRQFWED